MFFLPKKFWPSTHWLLINFLNSFVWANLARAYDPEATFCMDENPCAGCTGRMYWCDSNGYCQYTFLGGCAGTGPLPGGCEFGSWSACSNYYQTRRCEVGAA